LNYTRISIARSNISSQSPFGQAFDLEKQWIRPCF